MSPRIRIWHIIGTGMPVIAAPNPVEAFALFRLMVASEPGRAWTLFDERHRKVLSITPGALV